MNTTKTILAAIATASCTSFATTPVVSNVTMAQSASSRLVTINYTLDSEAVVTLDIQTNYLDGAETKWASIGGAAISGTQTGKTSGPAQGDVWKVVSAGSGTITWRPDYMWPDHVIGEGGARAVVTAWALDNPPDYMVADLADATVRYYPGADFLPGGLLANEDYRKTKFVLRKIMAKDIEWTKGGNSTEPGYADNQTIGGEPMYTVQIDNNYYIGVFEVTQTQWNMMGIANTFAFQNADVAAMRPADQVSFNEARGSEYPSAPTDSSFLGKLRAKFSDAYAFDLPSEAQWEFACRAGHGLGLWNDGSRMTFTTATYADENLPRMARYKQNNGWIKDGSTYTQLSNPQIASCTDENGPAICGSYEPNDWGLYDMEGNLLEWCLDWFTKNETTLRTLAGKVNTTKDTAYVNGAGGHVTKGGSWFEDASRCRPGWRWCGGAANGYNNNGFRLALGL